MNGTKSAQCVRQSRTMAGYLVFHRSANTSSSAAAAAASTAV